MSWYDGALSVPGVDGATDAVAVGLVAGAALGADAPLGLPGRDVPSEVAHPVTIEMSATPMASVERLKFMNRVNQARSGI